jgi:hypothetical protein
MNRDKLIKLYKKYNLVEDDVYKHKHYLIITRQGIDKIQAIEKLNISYEVIKCESDFAAVKAIATKDNNKVETFGSAKYGGKEWVQFKDPKNGKTGKWEEKGSTTSWYILEMAEKRAMSRAVLKITGFYELGAFGEDESEDFKKQ